MNAHNEHVHFQTLLPPRSGSASVCADPDPGGSSLRESVRIRIQETDL